MTAILQLVTFLAILLIAIGTGLRFTVTKPQDDLDCYSCGEDESTEWSCVWSDWGKPSPPPLVWEQIHQILVEGTSTVCGTDYKSWSDYVKKKRETGLVTYSCCRMHHYLIDSGIRSLVDLSPPEEETRWKVFMLKYERWKEWLTSWLSKIPRPDLMRTRQGLRQAFEKLYEHLKYERWKEWLTSWLSKIPRPDLMQTRQGLRQACEKLYEHLKIMWNKIPQGSKNPGVWNAVLCMFFIWRTMAAVFSKPDMFHGTGKSMNPRKITNALTKAIGQKFVALKVIGTSKNFNMLHLLSKATHDHVFMKCLRSNATRAAKIGLAREFRVLGTISHSNVIRLGGWMRAGAACSLTLEWAKYGNLQKALMSHVTSFKLSDKMAVFRQVVQAVSYLHNSKVAHLNIRAKSILVFSKWSSMKLSGFSRSVKVTKKRLCNRFDLHPAAVPADVVLRRELYDPLKVDCWALGSLLHYLLTGDHHGKGGKSGMPMIQALEDYDMKCKKIVLTLISRLMSSDQRSRPDPPDILRLLSGLDK